MSNVEQGGFSNSGAGLPSARRGEREQQVSPELIETEPLIWPSSQVVAERVIERFEASERYRKWVSE